VVLPAPRVQRGELFSPGYGTRAFAPTLCRGFARMKEKWPIGEVSRVLLFRLFPYPKHPPPPRGVAPLSPPLNFLFLVFFFAQLASIPPFFFGMSPRDQVLSRKAVFFMPPKIPCAATPRPPNHGSASLPAPFFSFPSHIVARDPSLH